MRVASLGGTEAGLGRGAGADMMTASALAQLCSLGLRPCPSHPTRPASPQLAGSQTPGGAQLPTAINEQSMALILPFLPTA